jgi:UDP-galactopyranose mutase
LAKQEKDVFFVGRLAEYRYYTMEDVIKRALETFERLPR